MIDPRDTSGGAAQNSAILSQCKSLVADISAGDQFSPNQLSALGDPPATHFYSSRYNACVKQARTLAAAQKIGSDGMTPAGTTAAPVQIPLVYIVIAILFLAWMLK